MKYLIEINDEQRKIVATALKLALAHVAPNRDHLLFADREELTLLEGMFSNCEPGDVHNDFTA